MPEYWQEEQRFAPLLIGEMDEQDELWQLLLARIDSTSESRSIRGIEQIYRSTRWTVFEENAEGKEVIVFICYALDPNTGELVLTRLLEMSSDNDSDEDLRKEIAVLHIEGIPIVAETPERRARVDALLREAMTEGFHLRDKDGQKRRFRYTPSGRQVNFEDPDSLMRLVEGPMSSPSEARMALRALRNELDARNEAGRVLAALRLAISELRGVLRSDSANEADLQLTLSTHPILFGPEYIRVQSQYRLGAEYVMDYALVRASGLVDLVEIEASTHSLYTTRDNPTSRLVHAEQQVLDWLALIDEHGPYFRRGLPGLQQPGGFVVIGRSSTMTSSQARKLHQRNQMYRPSLQIFTYDDLLARASGLLQVLQGMADQRSEGGSVFGDEANARTPARAGGRAPRGSPGRRRRT